MESIETPRLGSNRTGQMTSPKLSEAMNEVVRQVTPEGSEPSALLTERLRNIAEADPLGSAPPPATVGGVVKSAADKIVKSITGEQQMPAFVDKVAERLAYERGGTRLYDAVLAKATAYEDELEAATLQELREIREEEAGHAALLRTCLEQLGADPTAQTPSADLVGVASSGLLQAASDPRTTMAQTLQVALAAELIDVASWETLIAMAENMGQPEMAKRFGGALQRENEHLAKVKGWYETLTLGAPEAPRPKSKAKRKQN
jgi:ferritin-like metal-binding protein YciE